MKRHQGQRFEGQVVDQRAGQDGVDRAQQVAGERAVLDLVGQDVDGDLAGELVDDQQGQVIGDKVIGGQAADAALAVGDGDPDGQVDDRRNQPVEQVHEQVGAVLPLLGPVDLPEALDKFCSMALLFLEGPLDHVFDGRVFDGQVVDGQVGQHARGDGGHLAGRHLDVLLAAVLFLAVAAATGVP